MSSATDTIAEAGTRTTSGIIWVAEQLTKSDSSPGIIALILFATLIAASIFYFIRTNRQKSAISEMSKSVFFVSDIEKFAENYPDLQHTLSLRGSGKKGPRKSLWEAWDEFSETIVPDDIDGPLRLRNSIRPASFLNIEDLGFGPALYRILPNTFVSAGLFLTFLGLVAALHKFAQTMTGSGNSMDTAMQDFMQIASAKFIMSLVGLLCSIMFTVLLRARSNSIDRELHKLCIGIERRLVFVSLEDLGFRQLRAATEQREHLREIGMGMVAELQKPLEALPDRITSAIADRMDPIFDRVTAMGTSNMEGMVGDLSTQLSQSVGNALTRASESLGEATDRIGLMVDRMGATNTQAGEGLQTALNQMAIAVSDMQNEVATSGQTASDAMNAGAENLLSVMNETLTGIRDNTSQGAEAMRTAAQDMGKAAEGFRDTLAAASADSAEAAKSRMAESTDQAGAAIEGAGQSLLDSFGKTSREIAKLGTDMSSTIGDEILSRMEAMSTQLEETAEAIQRSTSSANSVATGMNSSADAINGASESFRSASRELVSAAEPLRNSHERIESGLRQLGGTVETVSDTLIRNSASVATNAAQVLETAVAALGSERDGIRSTMEATRAALSQLSNEAEKLDEIDEMLGRALQQYNAQLDAALGSAQDYVTQMRDTLTPGVDALKSVVEQAENFMPAQKRSAP
jgi:methyl-accepting chemotaxis protein